ncbi:hypothetical protein, partial [Glutamicibacter sp.]|uniref:hypothetical protein n=1 Tax=Glutamicibacter sp. TaxID=1931995 RepID=UPI002FC797E5
RPPVDEQAASPNAGMMASVIASLRQIGFPIFVSPSGIPGAPRLSPGAGRLNKMFRDLNHKMPKVCVTKSDPSRLC